MKRLSSVLLLLTVLWHCASPQVSRQQLVTATVEDAQAVLDSNSFVLHDVVSSELQATTDSQQDEEEEQTAWPGAPPDTTAEELQQLPVVNDAIREEEVDDANQRLDAWIVSRVRNARAGRPERVRLLLTLRSGAWGCLCPSHFVAGSTDAHTGGRTNWLDVRWLSRQAEPSIRTDENGIGQGYQVWVEGRFTGERVVEDLRSEDMHPDGYFYRPWVFEVLRLIRQPRRAEPVAQVLPERNPR